jgi:hypothetical protein
MLQGLILPYANPPDECAETGLFAPNFTAQASAFDAILSALSTTQANIEGKRGRRNEAFICVLFILYFICAVFYYFIIYL